MYVNMVEKGMSLMRYIKMCMPLSMIDFTKNRRQFIGDQLTLLHRRASADLSMHLHLITNELVLLTRSTFSSPLYITLGSSNLKLLLPRFVLVTAVDLKIKRPYSATNGLLEATHRGVIMTSDLTGNEGCR